MPCKQHLNFLDEWNIIWCSIYFVSFALFLRFIFWMYAICICRCKAVCIGSNSSWYYLYWDYFLQYFCSGIQWISILPGRVVVVVVIVVTVVCISPICFKESYSICSVYLHNSNAKCKWHYNRHLILNCFNLWIGQLELSN